MPRVHPFAGYIVDPDHAPNVVAPAYDSLSPAERAQYAAAHPDNYLNAMKSAEDCGGDMDLDSILADNRASLERLLRKGCFRAEPEAAFYVYRLSMAGHVQTGLVGELAVADIEQGAVLRHELTRVEREQMLVDYQCRVGASSSPVALAFPSTAEIRDILQEVTVRTEPLLDLRSDDGVRQTLWRVDDPVAAGALSAAFVTVPVTYLTDGHHRIAAASRLLAQLEDRERGREQVRVWDRVLVALFPHDELRVLPFHRCVRDLGALSPGDFLDILRQAAQVTPVDADPDDPPRPGRAGEFTLVLDEACYLLRLPDAASGGRVDVSVLQDLVLEPILGIADSRADPRLEYVSGALGAAGVNRLRAAGWRVCFYCHPVSIEDVMRISDAGRIMPPKSTSFEPKVRSGLFLRLGPVCA